MSVQGHEAVKAAIYTLAQNNQSLGRNDTLEGGKHLGGSSDYLKLSQLSIASASTPLSRQEWLPGQVDMAKGPGACRCHG